MTLLSTLRRLLFILRVCAAHLLAHLLGRRLAGWRWLARRLPAGDLSRPRRLCVLLQDLGGTPIKFGQMLALQPDIISIEYCNALFDLLDRVPPFSFAEAERVLREEAGVAPAEMFERIEPVPIATASIGQVHVAWLDGRKVAVKVQRPAAEVDFVRDLDLMIGTMRVIRWCRLRRLYWLLEPISEFVSWTQEELDYRNEARYMRRLRENARDNEFEYVPEVFFVSRRVLVAEYLDGVTVLGYLRTFETGDQVTPQRLEAMGFDANQFARRMIENFLGDAFRHGLFHADLHPANLMILPGNVVGYVDFGITAVLSRFSRRNLVALTLAYTRGDLDGMCEAFFRVSTLTEESRPAAFRRGLDELARGWYRYEGDTVRLRKNFTLMMLDMLTLSRRTGILPERDVIKYIRSSIALDGLITRFAPGFDVGAYLAEVCDRQMQEERQRALVSVERAARLFVAGGNLAIDGPQRLAAALHRAQEGRPATGAGRREGRARAAVPSSAAGLAFLAAGLVALMTVVPEAKLGANLFTAELALLAGAVAVLTRTVLRVA